MKEYDIAIIGGGIVGLSTAYALVKKSPGCRIAVLEKENALGRHQSSRNSGVVHSGVYYKPGSLKAENCIRGKRLLLDFCDEYSVNYKICGKVIVATHHNEIANLNKLHERGLGHGIECNYLEKEGLAEIEPYLAGIAGIHIPSVAVIKFSQVVEKLSNILLNSGTELHLSTKVVGIKPSKPKHQINTDRGEVSAKYLINTAGLYCDSIAGMGTKKLPLRIIPFRGEYYELKKSAAKYCNSLIYPVPDPNYPFLGVHVTRMIDGTVDCGPNAVLALSREGYTWRDIKAKELFSTITYPGFIKFALKNGITGIYEVMRSLSKQLFLKSVQSLIPAIQYNDLVPGMSGVRAQAISANGKLVDDFYFHEEEGQLHVLNAPSPAATSCFSIGEAIASKVKLLL